MPARKAISRKRPSFKFLTSIVNRILKLNIVYLLGSLLILASFLIGVLITKVTYLEQNGSGDISNTDAAVEVGGPQVPTGPVDVSTGHLPLLGSKDAKVTVIEFSDFQCPFCKTLFDDSLSQIKKDYVDSGKVKFAYRHFPLTSIHPNAQKAAEASECANDQDNFWGYHDILFTNQAEWETLSADAALAKFVEYANGLGLNGAELSSCVTSGKFADQVNKDTSDGVDGTPATFVNGIRISGAVPYAQFKEEIDKALAK